MRTLQSLLFLRPTPTLLPKLPAPPPVRLLPTQPLLRRPFISTPITPETQSLHAARTLSYPASKIFSIISDINSYSTFLPYCSSSTVTSWSTPSSSPSNSDSKEKDNGKKYPQEAELQIGWAGYDETFRSKVFCVPHSVIEAVSGTARTTISKSDLSKHYPDADLDNPSPNPEAAGNAMFTSLLTTWRLREFPYKPAPDGHANVFDKSPDAPPVPQTEVDLSIEVQFASPVYAALSKAAAPKVAGVLMESFVKRAREVLGEETGRPGQDAEKAEKVEGDSALEGAVGGEGIREGQ